MKHPLIEIPTLIFIIVMSILFIKSRIDPEKKIVINKSIEISTSEVNPNNPLNLETTEQESNEYDSNLPDQAYSDRVKEDYGEDNVIFKVDHGMLQEIDEEGNVKLFYYCEDTKKLYNTLRSYYASKGE